jgi:PAS domain S-box-containing protein
LSAPDLERTVEPLPPASQALDILRTAISRLPLGILLADGDGIVVIVNREIERLFGYSDGELIGLPVDVLVPDATSTHHTGLRHAFMGHPADPAIGAAREVFGRRKDGSEVPVEIGLTPVRIHDSAFALASVIDVTERRRTQIALDERLAFERFVGELGADFVNMRPEEVDRAVEDALGRVVRTLGIDRSALFQIEDTGDFVHTHQSTRPGCAPPLPRISARREYPWHLSQIRAGELVSFTDVTEVPDPMDRESLRRLGTKSAVILPLGIEGHIWGALSFSTVREPRTWPADVVNRLRVVALIFANALARKLADERLRRTADAMTTLRDRFREENRYLRGELQRLTGSHAIVGHSPVIRRTLEQVRQAAAIDSPVLLTGETGTGKALLGARIHDLSARRERALVRVNCASTTALVEGRLFGTEQRSFAHDEPGHIGRLELANGSTVFFDEIADLPLEAQAGLIRVLQDRQIQPADGGGVPITVDVRVIAATRKDLKRCIQEGTFRDDLYYRLNVFPIHVPPLRDRREDIALLVWRFVDEFSTSYGRPIDAIDRASMTALQAYAWPGNARELRNVVEHAMIGATTRRLHIALPPNGSRAAETLEAVEREHIASVLTACEWRIQGTGGAAARLGMSPTALRARMTRLGIHRREA